MLQRVEMKIPKQRIAIAIGKKGEVKKQIEETTKTKIEIDSKTGTAIIEGEPQNTVIAQDIVKAIARGFSPEKAMLLAEPEYMLDIIELRDWVNSENAAKVKRARVIGRKGSAREKIEEKTNCFLSVQGKTISIIGHVEDIEKARKAVEMLLSGASHKKTFAELDRMLMRRSFRL
ncbi:MAG: RNA-processing protein [Candidatus Diapherotrites archaeon]|nr:RNA-processing protein [Candidatus Diapherotrites archaeon]